MTGDLRALSEAEREAFPLYARDLLVWNAAERIAADRVAELERRIGELADEYDHSARFYSAWPEHAEHVGRSKAYTEAATRLRAAALVRGEEVDRG